ncbi:unannotated protein [freshwater metagenome]|uniref:Unannotated protein n=1 Tax=freshwater metagenome TaxID=449393 RepID=A0A6J7RBL8_9ZZZZ
MLNNKSSGKVLIMRLAMPRNWLLSCPAAQLVMGNTP